jgi:hypothetical protein
LFVSSNSGRPLFQGSFRFYRSLWHCSLPTVFVNLSHEQVYRFHNRIGGIFHRYFNRSKSNACGNRGSVSEFGQNQACQKEVGVSGSNRRRSGISCRCCLSQSGQAETFQKERGYVSKCRRSGIS